MNEKSENEPTEEPEFIEEFVSDETIREEQEEVKADEGIDWDDGWTQAQGGKSKDLDILKTPLTTTEVKIPIDYVNKKYVTFYLRELTTEEQLRMMEEFYQFHQKTGKASMNFLAFYRSIFRKMVKETRPRINWKDARLYNKKFLSILMNYLPSPFDIEGSLGENETKNSKQLSEVNLTTTRKQL